MIWWTKKQCKDAFFHPPPPFPCHFCRCNTSGICTASQFQVKFPLSDTEWTPTRKSSQKWQLWPFVTSCAKDYEGQLLMQTNSPELPSNTPLLGGVPLQKTNTKKAGWGGGVGNFLREMFSITNIVREMFSIIWHWDFHYNNMLTLIERLIQLNCLKALHNSKQERASESQHETCTHKMIQHQQQSTGNMHTSGNS